MPPSEAMDYVVENHASIGRAKDNDWVLPDDKKYVSQRHAQIEKRDQGYYILDTSQNGVFINDKCIGRNNWQSLQQGDQLGIGDYEINVAVTTSPTASIPNDTASELPHLDGPIPALDLFSTMDADAIDAKGFKASSANAAIKDSFTPPVPSEPDSGTDTAELPDAIPEDWFKQESSVESMASVPPIPEVRARPRPASRLESAAPESGSLQRTDEGIEDFLAGAGRQDLKSGAEQGKTLRNAGLLLRAFTQGTMGALKARRDVKKELRTGQFTMIGPRENNPLKFCANTHDALEQLLCPKDRSYLLPIQAVHEAFDDITSHEVAVMAGMYAALQLVLERFDPEALERRLGKRAFLDDLLPMNRKAKTWELFIEEYREIAQEAEGDFNKLFLQEFARAYDEHIEMMRARRSDAPRSGAAKSRAEYN